MEAPRSPGNSQHQKYRTARCDQVQGDRGENFIRFQLQDKECEEETDKSADHHCNQKSAKKAVCQRTENNAKQRRKQKHALQCHIGDS